MTQPSREWKEPAKNLWDLLVVHKRSKGQSSNDADPNAKLDTVEYFDVEDGSRPHAISSKQEDKVRRSKVEIDMLEA